MAVAGKRENAGPLRGNNSFPVGNKARPNTSGRGGGGAGGDGTGIAAAAAHKATNAAREGGAGRKGNGKGKKPA